MKQGFLTAKKTSSKQQVLLLRVKKASGKQKHPLLTLKNASGDLPGPFLSLSLTRFLLLCSIFTDLQRIWLLGCAWDVTFRVHRYNYPTMFCARNDCPITPHLI